MSFRLTPEAAPGGSGLNDLPDLPPLLLQWAVFLCLRIGYRRCMYSLETLADLKRTNTLLNGNCGKCGHGGALLIDDLIARFGAAYVVIGETRISAGLRCERCGHKGGMLTLSPPATYKG